jgi:hypothetical protein
VLDIIKRRSTMASMRKVALGLAAVVAVSCGKNEPRTLRDSEGRTFSAQCTKEGVCQVTQTGGAAWPGKPELLMHRESRLIGICRAGPSKVIESPGDCRVVVCESDGDCPPAHGLPHGACVNGTCTEQSRELDENDAAMLCLWGLGLGRDTPKHVERLSMALNCGTPCEIPAPCRQY